MKSLLEIFEKHPLTAFEDDQLIGLFSNHSIWVMLSPWCGENQPMRGLSSAELDEAIWEEIPG